MLRISDAGKDWKYNKLGKYLCDGCGAVFICRDEHVRSGRQKTCGCSHKIHAYRMGKANKIHGHAVHGSISPTWNSWFGMKQRTTNPKTIGWKHYGARGIKVCARWLESFSNFLEDMGERPEGKSIDRINNDGNYEPSNCKWSTPKEQANNRRKRCLQIS